MHSSLSRQGGSARSPFWLTACGGNQGRQALGVTTGNSRSRPHLALDFAFTVAVPGPAMKSIDALRVRSSQGFRAGAAALWSSPCLAYNCDQHQHQEGARRMSPVRAGSFLGGKCPSTPSRAQSIQVIIIVIELPRYADQSIKACADFSMGGH